MKKVTLLAWIRTIRLLIKHRFNIEKVKKDTDNQLTDTVSEKILKNLISIGKINTGEQVKVDFSGKFNFKLEGILWAESGSIALINVNNKTILAEIGTKINDLKIVKILRESVLLKRGRNHYILELGKESLL